MWSNPNWELFEIVDFQPIVDLPGEFLEQGPDLIVVRSEAAATITIRVAYSAHLAISGGASLEPDDHGWTIAHLPSGGSYIVSATLGVG